METEYIQKKREILKNILEIYKNHQTIKFINKQMAKILSVSIPGMKIEGSELLIEYNDITKRLLKEYNQAKRFYLESIISSVQKGLDPEFHFFKKEEYNSFIEILMPQSSKLNCEIIATV